MDVMKADIEYAKLRDLPRTPCPPELKRKKVLVVDGFECLVFYNYVDKGEYGLCPTNHWFGILQNNPEGYIWDCALDKSVETLEDACVIILPSFKKAVERAKKEKAIETNQRIRKDIEYGT